MIIVEVGKGKNLDSALKEFKSKVAKTKLIKELRNRQHFTKKSVKKREIKLKATYVQGLNKEEE